MSRKSKTGVCCICGSFGKLSYEHVPPQKAYNAITIRERKLEDWLNKVDTKGMQRQGGIGEYTLCEECNSTLGSWYGAEYVTWARIALPIVQGCVAQTVKSVDFSLQQVYPLRFLKQVSVMFFSLFGQYSGPQFAGNFPLLAKFVWEKENKTLPYGIRYWMNLYPFNANDVTTLRRMPVAGKMSVIQDTNGQIIGAQDQAAFDEIAHPPFALYMTLYNKPFPYAQEITQFTQYGYDEEANVSLHLRIQDSSVPYPGA